MPKKYIVRLSDTERHHLQAVIKKRQGSAQKVRRAQILLKAENANTRQPRGYWMENRRRALSPRAWDRRHRATDTGVCGC
jgi:hypothetical protein